MDTFCLQLSARVVRVLGQVSALFHEEFRFSFCELEPRQVYIAR